MARLFFDLDSSDVHYTDTEGTELPDMAMVRNEATRFLATIFKDMLLDAGNHPVVVRVRDTEDRVVFSTMLTLQENWA